MPKISIEGHGVIEAEAGTRLNIAIEKAGIDILHRCGGNARCTTCQVAFTAGEPAKFTQAEKDKLIERELFGKVRLSCQILCDHDMSIKVLQTVTSTGMSDPGGPLTPELPAGTTWA